MGGAYHGHTRVLIDMSPFKFEGAGGEGRQPWVHVLPCPDPYRCAAPHLPDAPTLRALSRAQLKLLVVASRRCTSAQRKAGSSLGHICCRTRSCRLGRFACWAAATQADTQIRPCRISQALSQRRLAQPGCSDACWGGEPAPRPAGACTWTAARRPRRRSPRPRRPAGASAPSSPSPSCPAAGRRARASFLATFLGRLRCAVRQSVVEQQ